jgi:phosphopantetheinyl transferase
MVEADATPECSCDWLSDEERSRLEKISDPARRNEYVSARIIARYLAGAYLGIAPSAVVLKQTPNNKCSIIPPEPDARPLFTGWSHSNGVLLMAFSRCEIGVDVEVIRDPQHYPHVDNLLKEYLRKQEYAECGNPWRFTAYWTACEALFKVSGKGTLLEMLRGNIQQPEELDAIQGCYFDLGETHMGALAYTDPCDISGYKFSLKILNG